MNVRRQLRAVLLLPGVVTVAVPAIILWWTQHVRIGWGLTNGLAAVPVLLGATLIGLGLALGAWTVELFARVGHGTLAPWDPTSRLVVRGPYTHVRNPMITGVFLVLAGESVLLGSRPLGYWLGAVVAVNAVYIPLVEEPGLGRRFGAQYDTYRENVPRWLPRLRSWSG